MRIKQGGKEELQKKFKGNLKLNIGMLISDFTEMGDEGKLKFSKLERSKVILWILKKQRVNIEGSSAGVRCNS